MANLRTAMDSAFWDQPISSPRTLEGSAGSMPGDPFPLDATRASRALRIQQLSLLGNGFPLGIIPSHSPTSNKDLATERHGEKKRPRHKMMLLQQSISLDLSSLVSESGFRYRFGIHKSNGHPKAINAVNDQPPLALMPGLCGKVSFSYENRKDLWRKKQTKKDVMVKADKGWILGPSNDARLSEPHAAISGSIGGSCAACFGGRGNSASADGDISTSTRNRGPSSADLFGSVCCTFQHGKFTKRYGDLTRVDARLDIYSAFAVTKRAFNIFRSSVSVADNGLSSPTLNLIIQQQALKVFLFFPVFNA
ncbi:hypothetical protein P3X46_014542 [Hevea brasiliensis]|uniref:Uncharacterized protein n=1 Tax=Hevea brasiliensis TaxID=3981 RepID=A0ABQ9LT08_HEVBR|nr:hypothetical protein P3X46_014542 [Hevea brasiliensis]